MTAAHILCVDDSDDNLKSLAHQIECAGYRVTAVKSGEAALVQIENEKPDLVLLDLGMPGIDGLEVLRRLRRALQSEELPIIMIADSSEEDEIAGAFEFGADDYIVRPVFAPVVLARLRSQLARCAAIATGRGERERFALAVAGSSDGIWDWVIKTDQLYFSPRCLELFGFDKDAALHQLSDWVALLHPDDVDVFQLGLRDRKSVV